MRAELALDALEMAIWARQDTRLDDLVHHSDRGVQYLSVRYTQRLADEGAVASVGSRGDSYDNALAEAVNGLYKAELIGPRGPWRTASQVELATLAWVGWWNQRRLHGALDHIPPCKHPTVQASIKPRAVQPAGQGLLQFLQAAVLGRSWQARAGCAAGCRAGRGASAW